ncbi:hypothetical protein H9655_12535 [Cytobacillus sp. Sa5YUA1]|uniref:Uncharacterized protein n=1 Tax=Cytobacillus stercorigallinarum TaxID=2762240 RepID=A0ABR8QQN6_9BACI|nr:hypothetical protein [Cytobacillus stercorigallinarum]MBD7937851.1 hypothetical protein [Cytobacillus stercorigallinarum]
MEKPVGKLQAILCRSYISETNAAVFIVSPRRESDKQQKSLNLPVVGHE